MKKLMIMVTMLAVMLFAAVPAFAHEQEAESGDIAQAGYGYFYANTGNYQSYSDFDFDYDGADDYYDELEDWYEDLDYVLFFY